MVEYSPAKFYGHQLPRDRSKGTSSFAFVFSIFLYTSIFYAFNISPSTLITNTKFWFFISNTLILIIAADYKAFSSPKQNKQLDLYHDELRSRPALVWGTPVSKPVYVREVNDDTKSQAIKVDDAAEIIPENEAEGKELVALEGDRLEKSEGMCNEAEIEGIANNHHETTLSPYNNSNEEEISVLEEDDEFEEKGIIVVHEGVDERGDLWDDQKQEEEEDDEFSAMSDEDLNKRVEEFILKLKRQIRLQGVGEYGRVC